MTTLLFVHGTGVREPHYTQTLDEIRQRLQRAKPQIVVEGCSWGEAVGVKLDRPFHSIPLYESTRDLTPEPLRESDLRAALWAELFQDPLFELRVLALRPEPPSGSPGPLPPGQALDRRVRAFEPSAELASRLKAGGLGEEFASARQAVTLSDPYQGVITAAVDPVDPYRLAIARALLAQAVAQAREKDQWVAAAYDADLLDALERAIVVELSDGERGLAAWVTQQVAGLVLKSGVVDYYMGRKRGAVSDVAVGSSIDILNYIGQGQAIRDFIRRRIEEVQPPVVVMGHSLGGIAALGTLVETDLRARVPLLITVGSQAPLLYEINALPTLKAGEALPDHIPAWLNIYDLRDYLSYIGGPIFPNRVQDFLVDNRQPFPEAHSAYWANEAVWNYILPHLP